MSLIKVKEFFKKYNKEQDIMEFSESSATVNDAAYVIGCKDADIAKTLSFYVSNQPVLVVLAGDKKVDNHKYKDYFHKKARMIPSEKLESVIGHQAGGICPFGINDGIKVYLDLSLKEHEFFYPACGSSNSAIRLTLDELEKYSNFEEWIDVSK